MSREEWKMNTTKILGLGAVGLAIALLFTGVAMAVGPNGSSDDLAKGAGTSDQTQDRLRDGGCDGGMCKVESCSQFCEQVQSCDHVQLRHGSCDQDSSAGGDRLRTMDGSCDRDQLRLMDGPCHST